MTEAIIIAIISSGVLSTIVSAIITALSNRKSRLKTIASKLDEIEASQRLAEKDRLRTQMLLMIADFPEEVTEILKLGEHYFNDLNGNWTATAIFNTWADAHGVQPEWLRRDTK